RDSMIALVVYGWVGWVCCQPKKPQIWKIENSSQLSSLPSSIASQLSYRAADGSLQSLSTLNTIQNAINRRTAVRETVFRDPNPATMPLDEAFELDRKTGKIAPPQQK